MATYFKFKLQEGFTADGNSTWGGEVNIPFDGGKLKIKSWDSTLNFYFVKPGMPNLRQSFSNAVAGAIEPGSEAVFLGPSGYSSSYSGSSSTEDISAKMQEFRSKWFNVEKMKAGMLMVNTQDHATYSVGGKGNEGLLTLQKDVWTTHSVLSDQYPYLGFQMTLVNE